MKYWNFNLFDETDCTFCGFSSYNPVGLSKPIDGIGVMACGLCGGLYPINFKTNSSIPSNSELDKKIKERSKIIYWRSSRNIKSGLVYDDELLIKDL